MPNVRLTRLPRLEQTRMRAASGLHPIEWTANTATPNFQHMGVDHGSADIGMPQQVLYGTDVIAILQKMRSKTMPEGVWRCRLGNVRTLQCVLEMPLEHLVLHVMTPLDIRAGISAQSSLREHPEPLPTEACMGKFVRQGIRHPNGSNSSSTIV